MIMEKAVRQQICSMILVLALLSFFFFFFFFPVSESSPFLLTIPIALLSTIILVTLTKKKGSVEENPVHEKLQKEELEYFTAEVESESENLDLNLRVDDTDEQHCNSQSDSSSSSLVSDSESSSTSSMMGKGCEIDDNYKDQNPGMCYSLVSENDDEEDEDEDSLIEIDLLSSSFSGFGEEQKHKMQTKVPHDFLPESIFKHKDLMGLLAETIEMNEDDNLIEIDISMDSIIKCQDLRLKQELALLGEK